MVIKRNVDTEHRYAPSNYDDNLCLKPPLLLWLAAVYLSRSIMLPIAMAIASFANVNTDAVKLVRGLWDLDAVAPSSIAFLVFLALLFRAPGAVAPIRWIWAHGRGLLALSAAAQIATPFIVGLWRHDLDDQLFSALFFAAGDAYFLAYLLAARRVRDTFADFPATLPSGSK